MSGFMLKRWRVLVSDWANEVMVAPSRGRALADTWRCDVFNGYTFGQFLKMASCRREPDDPPRFGDPITVCGKPAFFVENNRAYVIFAYPGGDHTMSAHPYDVEPESYRPDTYRDRNPA
ncbi:MAG: hypothetical protein ABW043_16850 [Devosia sp.]|uniref:hypothetical protein n=1 Tax=Devosia sp. TaxID=1871048 RepID=UPI003390C557